MNNIDPNIANNTPIYIVGHFANFEKAYDGQTIKTIEIYRQLTSRYGNDRIKIIDTHNQKQNRIKLLLQCILASKKAKNIIIIPASNGAKKLVPIFVNLKKIRNFKLHYILIGAAIYQHAEKHPYFNNCLRKINYIYAETQTLQNNLKKVGVKNVQIMRNFKNLKISKIKSKNNNILRCCIFSRIEPQKGVEDAIRIVDLITAKKPGRISLDIYGKISADYQDKFNGLLRKSKCSRYMGVVKPSDSVQIISKYDILLFPTKYYTEGIPGTIIDAFFSGTPIIASKWENFKDVIKDGKTGIGYEFEDIEDFEKKVEEVLGGKHDLKKMSAECRNMRPLGF